MKTKKIFKSLTLSLVLLLSAIILFACTEKDDVKREYLSSGNGCVVTETVGGETVYRAVADDWFEFVGWYDGHRKYSEEEVLIIKKNTPAKMEARFKTSAKQTFDRYLNSFYNNYVVGQQKEGEYFNYNLTSEVVCTRNDENIEKNAVINGYIDFGKSSQLSFEIKDKDKADFALYYDNSSENATVFLKIDEEKHSYSDMGLLTNLISVLPSSSQTPWSINELIKDEEAKDIINKYFGVKNPMGLINQVENANNASIINISYHKVLNILKNIADNSSNASSLKKLIHSLTCEYEFNQIPDMILEITTNYENVEGCEFIKDFEIKFNLKSDYIVNFDGTKVTIPKTQFNLKVNTFSYGFSESANAISNEILSSFPQPTVNMINVHTDGELDFISKTKETQIVVDKYTVEFDADLNPLALVSFNKDREGNYYDIDWEKLGFLSFKVSLIAEAETNAYEEQQLRHNSDYTSQNNRFGYTYSDYINVLIDTKNNGANAYVYLALYSPYTPFTRTYIVNHSYNIPSLLNMIASPTNSINDASIDSNFILKMLLALVSCGLDIDSGANSNEIFQNVLTEFLGLFNIESETVNNNFNTTESGFELSLEEIRTKLRNYEQEMLSDIGFSNIELKLDKVLLGDDQNDKITHIVLNMNKSKFDQVVKNTQGDYLSGDGDVLIDEFNNAHKVLVGVSEQSGISELTNINSLEGLLVLKGNVITLEKGILSDGSEASEFINNKGQTNNTAYKKIKMTIQDIEVLSSNETSLQIRVVLQFKDYSNAVGNFGDEIYKNLGVPYGLIVYQTSIYI